MRWCHGGAALGCQWHGALHSEPLQCPSMFSGVPAQCTTKANIQILNDGDRIIKFKILKQELVAAHLVDNRS